jgi:hypothetical protein
VSCAELQISALCAMDAAARVQLELFRQSSTLGVRQAPPPVRPPPQPPGGGVGVLLAYQPWHARAHRGVLGVLTPGHFRPALQTLVQRFALERRWVELAHPLGTVRVGRRPRPTPAQPRMRTPHPCTCTHAQTALPGRRTARTQLARGHSSPRRTQANAQRRASPTVLLTRHAIGASSSCSVLFRGHRRELSGHF